MTERTNKACRLLAWSSTILGGILITGGKWADCLSPWIFDAKGECRTDGVFHILAKPLLQLYMMLYLGWLPGSLLVLAGATVLVFLYGRNSVTYAVVRSRPLTTAALSGAVLAHATVAAVSSQFFYLPDGAEIRPMAWSLFVFLISFFSLVTVVPFGIAATIKEKPRLLGVISVMGGLTPLFTAFAILSFAERTKGLQMQS